MEATKTVLKKAAVESWVCLDSPTGAHYWVIASTNGTRATVLAGHCKYCAAKREFPTVIAGVL